METGEALLLMINKVLSKMPSQIFTGKVSSLNEDGTVDVERDEGDVVSSVKLAAVTEVENDFTVIPKKNSFVVCGIEDNDMTEAVILLYSEISSVQLNADEIILNKGELGGLVLVNELKSELEKVTARIDLIVDVLKNTVSSAALHPNPSWSGIITPILDSLDKEDFSDIENEKIKQ